ncbi:hypothetical protein [Hoeflea sp.]|uniref:hypothetical protein n=1 Tax=Hoeflea sp. TaxID=1940281 RepID=UPI003A91D412
MEALQFGGAGLRSRDAIGNPLHGLDLHGDVEPVDDVGCRLRHGTGHPLENFCAVRNHRHIAKAAISGSFKRVEHAIANCMLGGAIGDEIEATWFASSSAAASGNDELEVSRCIGLGAANMSGIDADDEFLAAIAGKLHLKLVTVIRLSSRLPCFPHNLVVEPFVTWHLIGFFLICGTTRLARYSLRKSPSDGAVICPACWRGHLTAGHDDIRDPDCLITLKRSTAH